MCTDSAAWEGGSGHGEEAKSGHSTSGCRRNECARLHVVTAHASHRSPRLITLIKSLPFPPPLRLQKNAVAATGASHRILSPPPLHSYAYYIAVVAASGDRYLGDKRLPNLSLSEEFHVNDIRLSAHPPYPQRSKRASAAGQHTSSCIWTTGQQHAS